MRIYVFIIIIIIKNKAKRLWQHFTVRSDNAFRAFVLKSQYV